MDAGRRHAAVTISGIAYVQYWLPGMGTGFGTYSLNWTGAGAFAFEVFPTAVAGCAPGATPVTNVAYTIAGPFTIAG